MGISRNTLLCYLASEDQISEGNILWLSSLNLADIPYNGDYPKVLDWNYVKEALSKGMIILKTVATFVHKTGLFWLLSVFCLNYSVHCHQCHFCLKLLTIGTNLTTVVCL